MVYGHIMACAAHKHLLSGIIYAETIQQAESDRRDVCPKCGSHYIVIDWDYTPHVSNRLNDFYYNNIHGLYHDDVYRTNQHEWYRARVTERYSS